MIKMIFKTTEEEKDPNPNKILISFKCIKELLSIE